MSDKSRQEYKMSFTTGGLFLNESLAVARLHHTGERWDKTIVRAMEDGATALPKAASNRRTLREISNRLLTLSDDERTYLLEGASRTDQQALLWLATCRAYRFIREFALEVIRERYLSYQLDLPQQTFDILFDAKAEWHDSLASLSTSTKLKLRQVMFRMLREAGVISEEDQIQSAILSLRLQNIIQERNPNELAIFPGVLVEGAPV
ncbi:DUF1819 family protein [Falsihalocynthiibacter arcticus]|uniref:DUF1819 family protein n=1 Tax=Falsihalocynthiibacter arcticus TaxID=1579316 RepID=UPI003002FACD